MKESEIRKLRRQIQWSQFRLEQASGVSRNKIALHEQGYRFLNNEEIDKVLHALKSHSRSG